MVSFTEMYGSKYLSADDIGDAEVPATISTVQTEMLQEKSGVQKPRVILGFQGKTKKLVVNKVNASALAKGTKTQEFHSWVGTKVMLFTTETSMGPGVRLRVVTTAAQDMNDEIPDF